MRHVVLHLFLAVQNQDKFQKQKDEVIGESKENIKEAEKTLKVSLQQNFANCLCLVKMAYYCCTIICGLTQSRLTLVQAVQMCPLHGPCVCLEQKHPAEHELR